MARETYTRYSKALLFRPVRPEQDASLLIGFGRALYRASLGREDAFYRDYGRYGASFPAWISACVDADPAFARLLVEDGEEIALVVLGLDDRDATIGRVHHFCVASSHRGQGFGGLLEDYAREVLKARGCRRIRLNVAAGNARAIRFYKAQGWEETARRGGLLFMEASI